MYSHGILIGFWYIAEYRCETSQERKCNRLRPTASCREPFAESPWLLAAQTRVKERNRKTNQQHALSSSSPAQGGLSPVRAAYSIDFPPNSSSKKRRWKKETLPSPGFRRRNQNRHGTTKPPFFGETKSKTISPEKLVSIQGQQKSTEQPANAWI